MKHKYIISTMLALFFCVSSVGCAQAGADDAKTLWETALDSLFAAMSGETDAPEPEEEWEEEWDEEWEVDPEEEWEEHPEEEPEEEPGVYMNLDGMTIVAMAPFENGVGWIQYMKGKEMYTAAVRTDGRLLFEIPGAVWYASAFEDGAAYVVVSDNATYYSNADPSLGCYEQVAPASVHEEIYDFRGISCTPRPGPAAGKAISFARGKDCISYCATSPGWNTTGGCWAPSGKTGRPSLISRYLTA